MKANEIKDLSMEEMRRKLTDLKEELFNLRFQHETGQLENPQKMKQTKRDIARVKTIIRQSELSNEAG
ncbi:MAG: 50S ribosomal protein L29 [Deltaproteobacteria bacterium]|jgi:large subunit ribosomal protein L29|nr:50S ribosomal protein L29 [Deltaproteobacteria bacterium]MBW2449214.1 50S ribosomal protein L29 [Deltaproteobacteria bacterium]